MTTVEPIRDKVKIKNIKKELKKNNLRNFLLFTLGINSGLRISDLLKLKIKDVMNTEFVEITEQKTGKYKRFPLHKSIKSMVAKIANQCNPNDWLFPSRKGDMPITRIQAYRIIQKVCKNAGIIDNIGTHTLRKTFGYHFYQKTKDVALLQKILNHSTPSVTLKYIGINQDIIDTSLKKFAL